MVESLDGPSPKPMHWIGDSKRIVSGFPKEVRARIGGGLWEAQMGLKPYNAKPLKGFGGATVLEVVVDFDGNAFRAVYTVRFAEVVYVLHAFQKKSKRGIATPRPELDLIERRLRQAREEYEGWRRSGKNGSR